MDKKRSFMLPGLVAGLIVLLLMAGVMMFTDLLGGQEAKSIIPVPSIRESADAEVVGVEVYDLSAYEESSQASAEALAQMQEDWFPRQAVVVPKGPEGGEFPNAPLPIYDSYPGQVGFSEDGERYTITRTWIGDIAVGTEVTLEGVVGQGEWCFVTGETLGGWTSSGWVWCYRLFIPD